MLPNPAHTDTVGHEAVEAASVVGIAVIIGAREGIRGVRVRVGVRGGSGRQRQWLPPPSGQQGLVAGLEELGCPYNRMAQMKVGARKVDIYIYIYIIHS